MWDLASLFFHQFLEIIHSLLLLSYLNHEQLEVIKGEDVVEALCFVLSFDDESLVNASFGSLVDQDSAALSLLIISDDLPLVVILLEKQTMPPHKEDADHFQ